jgi:hypothetical protein
LTAAICLRRGGQVNVRRSRHLIARPDRLKP